MSSPWANATVTQVIDGSGTDRNTNNLHLLIRTWNSKLILAIANFEWQVMIFHFSHSSYSLQKHSVFLAFFPPPVLPECGPLVALVLHWCGLQHCHDIFLTWVQHLCTLAHCLDFVTNAAKMGHGHKMGYSESTVPRIPHWRRHSVNGVHGLQKWQWQQWTHTVRSALLLPWHLQWCVTTQ